jgi:uncharacterized protein YbjT (DUF2867 family)
MKNTILVTGATGTVGSQVVKQLTAIGADVRAAVRSTSKAVVMHEVPLVEFDLNKPETVEAAFEDIDKVFLATPLVANMVELDTMTIEAAKKAGVTHIVRLSVMGADAEKEFLLGNLHRQVEKLIEASGITYTILRPNSFFQNYITFTGSTIKSQNCFYLPLGDGKISFVDVRDVAAVAAAELTQSLHENQAYEVTGSEALSNDEIASILSKVLGQTINYVNISEETARQSMRSAGMPERETEMVLGLYAEQKAGNYSTISPAVEQITGKKPISFEQFVNDYIEAFR